MGCDPLAQGRAVVAQRVERRKALQVEDKEKRKAERQHSQRPEPRPSGLPRLF